LERTII